MKRRKNNKDIIKLEDVLPYIVYCPDNEKNNNSYTREYNGKPINMLNKTLQTFKAHGIKCYMCGMEGKFFKLREEKNDSSFFLSLYALDHKNNWILMTKDHLIPRKNGGSNSISNLRPMCYKCNQFKGGMKILKRGY